MISREITTLVALTRGEEGAGKGVRDFKVEERYPSDVVG